MSRSGEEPTTAMSRSGEEPTTAMSRSGEEPTTAMSRSGEDPNTQGEKCLPDELRTLFLFEALTDKQLETLCQNGHIATFQPGPVCTEGDPATCFYVLIEGELVMSKRSAGVDIETNRTSQRGVYCGAWAAYVPAGQHVYEASVRVTKPSRFFVLDADAFARFMQSEFPMAVHLVEGHKVGGMRQRQIIGQREKLLALGTITAGLTHQLNNPAAAITRDIADLRENIHKMRHKLAILADGKCSPEALRVLVSIQDEVAEHVAKSKSQQLSAIETTDREDQIGDWLEDHGIEGGWDYAPTFVDAGLDTDWLERISASIEDVDASAALQSAIGWLKYTIDTQLAVTRITEASKRISALLAGTKQYSQMDRAPYQSADIHELLHSTLMMFGDRIGQDGRGVKLVKEYDRSLPELLCYPGDLNQVWTNIIDNAIQAMGGSGTLTVRTMNIANEKVRVEICDDGPGIPEDHVDQIFTPFFTTKPFGEGTGLGLDLAWRIVVEKHHGNLRVESKPGDTRFIIVLPLVAPAPEAPTPAEISPEAE
jgi:signal transduction histidine kinase